MKNLCRKSTVHPITPPLVLSDQLSLLPATILALTAALSQEDKQVLAYLIACSSNNFSNNLGNTHKNSTTTSTAHPYCFNCYCFNCYMSYWVKWDSSPNHQLIHEIIDAFEDMVLKKKKGKSKKQRRNKNIGSYGGSCEVKKNTEMCEKTCGSNDGVVSEDGDRELDEGNEKGSVRRFVSFLGQSFWSVWLI
ncbi:uncharacterized protein LOC132061014 [Lycium ferocissimum]|uniref:uncharacterized protein LOC132061014 n=1 Tax=Lycium ferocissimum TaxID=112874 RepID=UPI002816174E|nr:uncharacterized protein LOC132061014 [Lycium ferocissimum]